MTAIAHPSSDHRPVTRAEIAAAIAPAFGSGAVHLDAIIATARAAGARRDVLELLYRLPAYRYQEQRQVWDALPGRFAPVRAPLAHGLPIGRR